jgi:hypothetical protein
VLEEGILDLPMIWQTDAFALATGFDDTTGRYVGLWLPTDQNSAPSPTDSLMLVRPEVAERQREEEQRTRPPATEVPEDDETKKPDDDDKVIPVVLTAGKTRFYGVKTISSDKIAVDFRNLSDEVLAHLRDPHVNLVVRIEIEATDPNGFDENTIRTVSENARVLKFDQSGFESS